MVPASRVRREAAGPALSVIVCSQDRAAELRDCVEALVAHGTLASGCEIVIVDSGSTDETPEVAAELARRHPGSSTSRGRPRPVRRPYTGARAARHDVLTFIDDDARPAPGGWRACATCSPTPASPSAAAGCTASGPRAACAAAGFVAYFSVMSRGDAPWTRDLGDFYGANWSSGARRSTPSAASTSARARPPRPRPARKARPIRRPARGAGACG